MPLPPPAAALSLPWCVGWAGLIAVAMSTQLLVQPFVWRHWPWDEVLSAWLQLAAQRLVVALTIALAVWLIWQLPARSLPARAFGLGLAFPVGALAGESVLVIAGALDAPHDAASVVTRDFRGHVSVRLKARGEKLPVSDANLHLFRQM